MNARQCYRRHRAALLARLPRKARIWLRRYFGAVCTSASADLLAVLLNDTAQGWGYVHIGSQSLSTWPALGRGARARQRARGAL